MIKLYEGMSTRLGEKHLGRGKCREKMEYGARLKPGDLISSCKGYNEVIHTVKPEYWQGLRRGKVVVDFDIETISGSSCSLWHCCTVPLETKEQVVAYWMRDSKEYEEWAISFYGGEEKWKNSYSYIIRDDLRAGIEVFNHDGTISRDYNHFWCVYDKDGKEIACYLIRKQADKLFDLPEAHSIAYKTYNFDKEGWDLAVENSKG